MEEASLAAGFQHIKFQCKKLGTIRDLFPDEYTYEKKFTSLTEQLAEALYIQEHHGLSPVCPDGKVGGNGAAKISIRGGGEQTGLLVSKSGKYPGRMDVEQDFCIVTCFDRDTWSCEYYSNNDEARPTCDTPMHFSVLFNKVPTTTFKSNQMVFFWNTILPNTTLSK